jgi:LuxR family maltose regulon positive regulatory protein
LTERLNAGLAKAGKLTLVSAPAGFGKTTLVSEWIAQCERPVAWLSLDEGDNDLTRFLSYLIAALQTVKAGIGESLLAMIQSHQLPQTETILTALLNELVTITQGFVLVLDDYHVIDSKPLDEALAFFVERFPPQMHLVIATREDPHLPLARLRSRGQLIESRAVDLRFTPAEASEFLNCMMGLRLSEGDIAALETRTEGWIAGLQLAALSMQGREDIAGFIQAFTGSHRFVLDYLVEEVLQRQPESTRNFLLQTAILERFCAPLCNAVTERDDGKDMLSTLEDSNLFLVPLDDQRQWYRYHHLFAEVLQSYLLQEQPDQMPKLHRRASIWFEENNLTDDAIPHALAAKDFERAADLIERNWREKDITYQYDAWLTWVKSLPDEIVRAHPVICVGYAWALLGTGELEASESRLLDAERWLQSAGNLLENSSSRMIVVDEKEFRSLPASISAARAYRALALGDIPGTKMYARQTLALAPDETTLYHTQATALLALAEYASGDLQEAEQDLLKFQALMWKINDLASAIGITFALANIKLVQGHLREAVIAYQQSLQLAANRGATFFIGVSELHRGLGELLCEQNNLEAAAQSLLTAQQMGEKGATTGWPQRLYVAQSRLKASQGDLTQALACLEEAERQYVQNPLPDPPIAALKARIWVRQGRLIEAFSWVREQNLSPEDELSFIHEFEHLTLSRVLIARYKADQGNDDLHAALGLLERLLQAAEAGGRNGSVIEILILQALAYQAQGNHSRAIALLERALSLAGPEGYVRTFVDEGEAMRLLILNFRSMLEEREHPGIHPLLGYVNRLFATFPESQEAITQSKTLAPYASAGVVNRKSEIAEPLSERELDVLRLLRSELSGPEIAEQLIVSLNTLRTHTKSIYNKLGVNNRRAAVRRAEELNLF